MNLEKNSYDKEAHKALFDKYLITKYSNGERSTVIWKVEGKAIIKAFQKDFKYSTPQFKYRIEKRRKFTLEYDEDGHNKWWNY